MDRNYHSTLVNFFHKTLGKFEFALKYSQGWGLSKQLHNPFPSVPLPEQGFQCFNNKLFLIWFEGCEIDFDKPRSPPTYVVAKFKLAKCLVGKVG